MSFAVKVGVRRLLSLCLLIASATAAAQGLPAGLLQGIAPSSPATAASTPPPTSVDEWQARLQTAQAEDRLLQAQPEGSSPLLAERQLASARRVDLLAARLAAVRAQSSPSGGDVRAAPPVARLSGPPPYSVLDVDSLRDQLDGLIAQQSALRLTLKSLDAEFESAVSARAAADAALRRQRERATRGNVANASGPAAAELELAVLQAQVAELELVQADASRQQQRARLALLEEPVAQLQREVDRVRGQQRLGEAELKKLVQEIGAEGRSLAAERVKLAEHLTHRQADDTGGDAALAREVETLQQTLAALRELESVERHKAVVWRHRQDALDSGDDLEKKRAAAAALSRGIERAQARLRSLSEQNVALASEMRTQRALLRILPAGEAARAGEQRVLDAMVAQRDMHFRLRDAISRIEVLMSRSRSDLGVADRPDSLAGWVEEVRSTTGGWLAAIWNFELFSATETTQVDGRTVTADYGVTVGKSVGVLVLFGLGYWGSGYLSRMVIGLMQRRLHLSPHLARVLRRWLSSILVLVVLMVVLKLARIPITAFAFLGGALAIGIGFGTQNIIKNIISGIIILFERKIRVGDIVTIGGVSGTVQTVDLRATTVRGFDGIDAIVPNSTLLENQISNWSGGSPEVRRTIAVGVAYGSDVSQAAQIILRCAQGNPEVLAQPPADVLFEDFGADSLLLRLRYWTRLDGPRGGPGVDSDLRFAIHDALRDVGISIAFPQRDVHLDVPGSLRVELTAAPAPAAAGEPGSADSPR
jgi:small-conductance mechanosensitive channel